MMYRAPDGRTFSSYTSFCDYMALLSRMNGDNETAEYYKRQKEKSVEKQERAKPWGIALLVGWLITLVLVFTGVI